ncbi:MAG: hypothetical protein BroJett014_20280 [Planctomycetota bacterium]|nr:hypothetical protein [Planctomycetota bacterium]GIK53055.1 MAG: hypothetical protein BroJett014_20280 [Planctomycetota bacterium]
MQFSDPLAYFITWACYGTRLHGDERGTVDREHNIYGTPTIRPAARRVEERRSQLKEEPFVIGSTERGAIESAIRKTCDLRGWVLRALNVRTNHVHVVVCALVSPEKVMNDLKAWSTRYMRDAKIIGPARRVWTRHGSTRRCWNEGQLTAAIRYVLEGQGTDLPKDWFERAE